jgi:hypothetical protein
MKRSGSRTPDPTRRLPRRVTGAGRARRPRRPRAVIIRDASSSPSAWARTCVMSSRRSSRWKRSLSWTTRTVMTPIPSQDLLPRHLIDRPGLPVLVRLNVNECPSSLWRLARRSEDIERLCPTPSLRLRWAITVARDRRARSQWPAGGCTSPRSRNRTRHCTSRQPRLCSPADDPHHQNYEPGRV